MFMLMLLLYGSDFIIMSQVTVTTTTTLTMVLTSMGQAAALGKHDVVLLPPLIMKDTVASVVGQYVVK